MAKGLAHGGSASDLKTLFEAGAVAGLTDGELLGRFIEGRDKSSEAAFEVLVHRHGPLVFGVCRRRLGDAHQSEDAFQATFLVLARKARSIRDREAVGPWLVGVASKVAARAKGDASRRRLGEGRLASLAPDPTQPIEPDQADEVAALLVEVDRLRRPLREAVVLCYLQGLTYDLAGETLGVSEGAIRGRLARAREILRDRLRHRGFARDASASIVLAPRILEPPPAGLVEPTVRASMAALSGRALTGIVPGSAITLMEGALKAMGIAKLKSTAVVALGVGLIGLGTTLGVQARQKPETPASGEAAKAKPDAHELASLVEGRIVRSAEVTKDCMVLAYLPDWGFGNVDNIGVANNDGGVRTLVSWPDVPSSEAKSPDLKFYLAFYSRKTQAMPKPGSILAFEVESDWPERTSWKTRPSAEPEPVASAKFEPGEGWKLFEITSVVRDRSGHSGNGLMLRFLSEDHLQTANWSGYEFVSREGQGNWAKRRPRLIVVDPGKK